MRQHGGRVKASPRAHPASMVTAARGISLDGRPTGATSARASGAGAARYMFCLTLVAATNHLPATP
jgi:hypothetical protein